MVNAQVLIGTMGKLYEFFTKYKCINCEFLKAICVDEFDNIVVSKSYHKSYIGDDDFILTTEKQLEIIMDKIPLYTQRVFFSATVPEIASRIANRYFRPYNVKIGEPFIVLLNKDDDTLDAINQYYVNVDDFNSKIDVLLDLLKQCRIQQAIIFTNRMETSYKVKEILDKQNIPFPSSVFNGKLTSNERNKTYSDTFSTIST